MIDAGSDENENEIADFSSLDPEMVSSIMHKAVDDAEDDQIKEIVDSVSEAAALFAELRETRSFLKDVIVALSPLLI